MGKLQPSDLASYRFLSGVQISPDREKVAFIVKQADLQENDYASNLFLCWLDTGKVTELTRRRRVVAFGWLSDSDHIRFIEWERPEQKDSLVRTSTKGGLTEEKSSKPAPCPHT